jgi:hypothetical protein
MQFDTTRALARPQHPFDIPALVVLGLSATASMLMKTAIRLDGALSRARRDDRSAGRPRARLGPGHRSHSDFGVPDSWRIR